MTALDYAFKNLPDEIPVFPLKGGIIFPNCNLSLNMFEPRYLNLTLDAFARQRIIGLVQPMEEQGSEELCNVGSAGRIVQFQETGDGRFLIVLRGVSRFDVEAIEETERGYLTAKVSFDRFGNDLMPDTTSPLTDNQFFALLTAWCEKLDVDMNVNHFRQFSYRNMVNLVAMSFPFAPLEKQALLEIPTIDKRFETVKDLMRMYLIQPEDSSETPEQKQ